MKLKSLTQPILAWYYEHVKYRKYAADERRMLSAFEFGIRARVEAHSLIPTLMRYNIDRVCALYNDDFNEVSSLDTTIKDLQSDFDASIKELDDMDKTLWRMVFVRFVETHDNETCNKVWGVSIGELDRLRGFIIAHNADSKT